MVRFPGIIATAAALFYIGWNAHWLSQWRLPPSIAKEIFGVPAPTTGMTRSVRSLMQGDWLESLLWNPMTLPFLCILMITLGLWAKAWREEGNYVMRRGLVAGWGAIFILAIVAKVVIGPEHW